MGRVWSPGGTLGTRRLECTRVCPVGTSHASPQLQSARTHAQGACVLCVCRAHGLLRSKCVCEFYPWLFSEEPPGFGSKQVQRGARGQPRGREGHSPCRASYCLICTSSTQSAGNQPVRPFTVPSQKPPSPMLSTGGTEAREAVRREPTPCPLSHHQLRLRLRPPTRHPFSGPSLHPPGLFPGKISGSTRNRNKQMGTAQGGHVGDRDTHTWTYSRAQEAEAGARAFLLPSRGPSSHPPCCCPSPGGQALRVAVWPADPATDGPGRSDPQLLLPQGPADTGHPGGQGPGDGEDPG